MPNGCYPSGETGEVALSVADGGNDPPGTEDDLVSVIELLEELIDELRERVRENKDDRIGPSTRSILVDALLPEAERVLAGCPENSQVRIARTYVSSRQNREDLGDPSAVLMTVDELAGLRVVLKALSIEQNRRGGKSIIKRSENPRPEGYGHPSRTRGSSEPNPPRYHRQLQNQNAYIEGVASRRMQS
jgi:hypothetical protein